MPPDDGSRRAPVRRAGDRLGSEEDETDRGRRTDPGDLGGRRQRWSSEAGPSRDGRRRTVATPGERVADERVAADIVVEADEEQHAEDEREDRTEASALRVSA